MVSLENESTSTNVIENFSHKCIIIKIRNSRILECGSVYEAVRYCWKAKIGRAEIAEYVLASIQGKVVGVFKPTHWYECTEENVRIYGGIIAPDRIGFVGKKADNEIQSLYLGRSIPKPHYSSQNPVNYNYTYDSDGNDKTDENAERTIDEIEKVNVIESLFANYKRSGIGLNSHIDFERFKAKYNRAFADFVLTEKQFNDLLLSECVIYDDRAYVFSEIEIDELRAIIEAEDSRLASSHAFYDKYDSELYDLGIYTVDILKAVIQKYLPEFKCRYGRFTKGASVKSIDLITACFKSKHVLTVKEIEAMCPELTTSAIRNHLSKNDEFIHVGRNTYTHIDYVRHE